MNATATAQPDPVRAKIERDFAEFRAAARNWSGIYHAFQFGSIILSAVAALVLKLDSVGDLKSRNDLGAFLAATAAVLITLITSGRFKEKWEANRVAAFAVRDLA